MAVKNFEIDANQKAWDSYYSKKLSDWSADNQERLEEIKKQKSSINQYKPILLELDGFLKKPFGEITLGDYEEFKRKTTKQKNFVHMHGFFIYCITNGFVSVEDKGFIKALIPELYGPLIELLM